MVGDDVEGVRNEGGTVSRDAVGIAPKRPRVTGVDEGGETATTSAGGNEGGSWQPGDLPT